VRTTAHISEQQQTHSIITMRSIVLRVIVSA